MINDDTSWQRIIYIYTHIYIYKHTHMDMPLMQHCPRLTASQQLLLFPGRTRPLRSRFRTWMCHTCHTCHTCRIFPCPTCPVCRCLQCSWEWQWLKHGSGFLGQHMTSYDIIESSTSLIACELCWPCVNLPSARHGTCFPKGHLK